MKLKKLLKDLWGKRIVKIIVILSLIFVIGLIIWVASVFTGIKLVCPIISDTKTIITTNNAEIDRPEILNYHRLESSTYLTYPEWHIVYNSKEYADFLKNSDPSDFPYFASIGQYWKVYCNVVEITEGSYNLNANNHIMLSVIGVSYTTELIVKGIYENTVGRFFEWTSGDERVPEEDFAYEYNTRYVDSLYLLPFYEYPYFGELNNLKETKILGPNILRKMERKMILSKELIFKGTYSLFVKVGTKLVLGEADLEIYATTKEDISENSNLDHRITIIDSELGNIIKLPRYAPFTEIIRDISLQGIELTDIAGNNEIFITLIAPVEWNYDLNSGEELFSHNILTDVEKKRLGVTFPVNDLVNVIPELENKGIIIEHIYDY